LNSSFQKPTVQAINKIRKKYNLTKKDALTSLQYKEALGINIEKKSNGGHTFTFVYKMIKRTNKGTILEIHGKHLSKNRIDSLRFRDKLRYKKAFKEAMRTFYMINKKVLMGVDAYPTASIEYIFYSSQSRDWDNNFETIKRVQDTLTSLRIIEDDKRENIEKPKEREVPCKKGEEKIVVVVNLINK